MSLAEEKLLIFDGACGSNLQEMEIPTAAWQGCEGCNELLNLTAPETIVALHRSFLDAGAMVVETNTFGASSIVLAEYGLADRVVAINRAAVNNARAALAGLDGGYVAGSIGPTTKLPSLRHIGVDELHAAMAQQVRALVEAGVDALVIETCQDLLQVKTALLATFEALEAAGRELPVLVSVTMERQGTMLVGSDIAAVCATLEPFPIFSLGLNCATGPVDMASHIRFLSRNWPGRISCMPNQGLPEVVDGKTCYPMSPDEYVRHLRLFIEQDGVSVVGGCCGTTPGHIHALAEACAGIAPAQRETCEHKSSGAGDERMKPSLSSLYQAVEIAQETPPLLIGERSNPNGSKRFRECLLADDFDGCLRIALEQEARGAQLLDLCAAYAGRDELADLTRLLGMHAEALKIPLVIDSTSPQCIEACLKLYPGRCLINSINLEDGGKTLARVCRLAKQYGAAVVALTIGEEGMAMSAADKLAVARRIHDLAVHEHGLRPQDLLFDPLTFTIGAGDENLYDAAIQTLEGIRRIKAELPGVFTLLGLSNISFGLPAAARRILNSVFLYEAVAAGLDAAIIDAGKILPLAQVSEVDRKVCLELIFDRERSEASSPLMRFIDHFSERTERSDEEDDQDQWPEEALHRKILRGDKEGIDDLLAVLLERYPPLEIVNQMLVPAMRHVGDLFGKGELLLPFVLQSAEAMKKSVAWLEPYMQKIDRDEGIKVLLATVQGDVHDIGKNLVDILLSNNGYKVFNIGIKVPAETIIERARALQVDLIGLSGLLVKSAIVMQESLPQYREAGLNVPILLGGAALTREFVANACVPGYDAPVVYCADAFAGLKALKDFEAGTLKATEAVQRSQARLKPGLKKIDIRHDEPVPEPPFLGARHVHQIDLQTLFPFVNEQALFRGRWGYRRQAGSTAEEYQTLVRETVRPLYAELKRRTVEDGLLQPKVAYGYFRCHSEGDALCIEHDGQLLRFTFPRQQLAPQLCIADFFRSRDEGGDVAAFFVVTLGERIARETRRLFETDSYHDYLMLHGFSVEVTDALAEYWHEVMRIELGIGAERPRDAAGYVTQGYQGSRYGFGYPACPDLDAHQLLFRMLAPQTIGVTLTENMEMIPEVSTSAIIAHHPQAKYFAV
jgi:5-methyltetrahydrofolate--homocysteine methyltransferase